MKINAYLDITPTDSNENRSASAGIYTAYRAPFLDSIKGALSKDLLIREDDVQVLHGFDSLENATNYLSSELFNNDVVVGLKPFLDDAPCIRIYSVA